MGLRWAGLLARLRAAGRSMPIKDILIATSALAAGPTIAARDVAHIEPTGVPLLDPFVSGP